MTRTITRTGEVAQHPWPPDMFLQGGDSGIVLSRRGAPYRTAFVEAFPSGTFLRGEGATVAEAEDACWEKYLTWVHCDNPRDGSGMRGPWHGPYERRQYRNGAGYCTRCGTWMSKVFPPLPKDPTVEPSLIEQLFRALEAEE